MTTRCAAQELSLFMLLPVICAQAQYNYKVKIWHHDKELNHQKFIDSMPLPCTLAVLDWRVSSLKNMLSMCWLVAKSRGAASARANGRMTDTQQGDDRYCSKAPGHAAYWRQPDCLTNAFTESSRC